MPPLTWGEGGGGNIWHRNKSCASEIPLPQSADPLMTLRVDYQSRHSNTAMAIARNSRWVHQCSLWTGGQKNGVKIPVVTCYLMLQLQVSAHPLLQGLLRGSRWVLE